MSQWLRARGRKLLQINWSPETCCSALTIPLLLFVFPFSFYTFVSVQFDSLPKAGSQNVMQGDCGSKRLLYCYTWTVNAGQICCPQSPSLSLW